MNHSVQTISRLTQTMVLVVAKKTMHLRRTHATPLPEHALCLQATIDADIPGENRSIPGKVVRSSLFGSAVAGVVDNIGPAGGEIDTSGSDSGGDSPHNSLIVGLSLDGTVVRHDRRRKANRHSDPTSWMTRRLLLQMCGLAHPFSL